MAATVRPLPRCGPATRFVNLAATPGYEGRWWGRGIFRVDVADAQFARLVKAGLKPETPQDASWGERFFHITDPDGHEISFAEMLRVTVSTT